MALKQIRLRKQISDLRAQLGQLDEVHESLAERRTAMQTREAELEEALNETNEQTSAEDRQALEESMDQFEQDQQALENEETANGEERQRIQDQIDNLQRELDELDSRSERRPTTSHNEERNGEPNMPITRRKFFGMNIQERDAFLAKTEVKEFLQRLRQLKPETRDVEGAGLTIPRVIMDIVGDNIPTASKMYKHVNAQSIPGTARVVIPGTAPEGIWTEMCATSNEVSLTINAVELDGYMVSAIIYVCNAVLKDSDMGLASHVITQLIKGLAKALDKAILFGTNDHMPLGIVTRLIQTVQPEGYSKVARPWVDISESNAQSIAAMEGTKLFAAIIKASGAADNDYGDGEMFWAMNNKTRTALIAEALSFSASGALTAGMNNTMPVIGGMIETINFMPDDLIVFGYGDLYPLAEREGATVENSTHYRFAQNQTAYKAIARYDGEPAVAEGFGALALNGKTVAALAAQVTFPADEAN